MKCLSCKNTDSRVLESRSAVYGSMVKRIRECLNCYKRFTTYEINLGFITNPMEMTKFHRYISAKVIIEDASPSKTDKLERKEFEKLLNRDTYGDSINLNKLFTHLNEQERMICTMRFFEKSTIEEVISWEGISEKEVRSAELKALKFLRNL